MVDNINQRLSIITIILCSIGVFGNVISLLICLQKKLRIIPTFIFLSFIDSISILILTTIGLCVLITQFLYQKVQVINDKFYNVALFLLFWEFQSSAYLKVSILI